jgi:hypothetical protein
MAAWARVGMECVCVDDFIQTRPDLPLEDFIYGLSVTDPSKGEVCRIEGISYDLGTVFLDIEGYEWRYEICHFRPLNPSTQEQDLAIFRPLLVTDEVPA